MKRPVPDDVDRLKLEHEAMASTLCEAENHVDQQTMKQLRRYYADYIVTSREHAEGRS